MRRGNLCDSRRCGVYASKAGASGGRARQRVQWTAFRTRHLARRRECAHVAWCMLHVVVRCMLSVACCPLHIVRCMLSVAHCLLHVACCLTLAQRTAFLIRQPARCGDAQLALPRELGLAAVRPSLLATMPERYHLPPWGKLSSVHAGVCGTVGVAPPRIRPWTPTVALWHLLRARMLRGGGGSGRPRWGAASAGRRLDSTGQQEVQLLMSDYESQVSAKAHPRPHARIPARAARSPAR